jgi:hypothetical protein
MKYPLMMKNRIRRTVGSFQKQRKRGIEGRKIPEIKSPAIPSFFVDDSRVMT